MIVTFMKIGYTFPIMMYVAWSRVQGQ